MSYSTHMDIKHAFTQIATDAELAARVAAFQQAYGSDWSNVWSDLRAQVIWMGSTLRSTFAWGAEFSTQITDDGKLQRLVFDKVYPHLEAARFPKLNTQDFSDALFAFQKVAMAYKREEI